MMTPTWTGPDSVGIYHLDNGDPNDEDSRVGHLAPPSHLRARWQARENLLYGSRLVSEHDTAGDAAQALCAALGLAADFPGARR